METYFHNDPRIRQWINQIVEKIFTVCLLTGVDSDAEFHKGCQIIIKLTSLLQLEFLTAGVKQLFEQQLPDARVINSFPAFQATIDRMLRDSLLMFTNSQKKEALNSLTSYTEGTKEISLVPDDRYTERPKEVSDLEFITHSVTPVLTTVDVNIPYPDIPQTKAAAQALADALIQANAQAKVDAHALADLVAQVKALTEAEKHARADALTFAEALAHAELKAKTDALAFADALAHAELKAKTDALAFADALTHANVKFEAVTKLEPNPIINVPALVTSVYSKTSLVFGPTQDPKQTNLLKHVLNNLFPKATVYWNKNLMGQKFLVQVEDILICLHDSERPFDPKKYNMDGWRVLVCSTEDLTFPRRLERGIRHIQRSVPDNNSSVVKIG